MSLSYKHRNNKVLKDYKALVAEGAAEETLRLYVKDWHQRLKKDGKSPVLRLHTQQLRAALSELHYSNIAEIFASEGDALAVKKDFANASLKYMDAANLVEDKQVLALRYLAGSFANDLAEIKASADTDYMKITKIHPVVSDLTMVLSYGSVQESLLDTLLPITAPKDPHELPAAFERLEKSFAAVRQWTFDNDPDTQPSLRDSIVKAAGELLKRFASPKTPAAKPAAKPGQTPEA